VANSKQTGPPSVPGVKCSRVGRSACPVNDTSSIPRPRSLVPKCPLPAYHINPGAPPLDTLSGKEPWKKGRSPVIPVPVRSPRFISNGADGA
jgi:hypothetical protein